MQEYSIHEDDSDQRLDRFLRKLLPGKSLGEIFRMIRTKFVRVNGKKSDQSYRLQEGDIVTFRGKIQEEDTVQASSPTKLLTSLDSNRIVFEDEDLLVYNKPAGMIVHPADHKTDEISLIQLVRDYLTQSTSHTFNPALAHRIDRDTSGIVISCKTKKSLMSLTSQFKKRTVQKKYLAFCHQVPEESSGIISEKILRIDEEKTNKPKVVIDPLGDSAQSKYEVIDTYEIEGSVYSLIEVQPRTGRMHQIRVHMSHIGHPLVGDKRYGGKRPPKDLPKYIEETFGDTNMGHFLHAKSIQFHHPRTEKVQNISL